MLLFYGTKKPPLYQSFMRIKILEKFQSVFSLTNVMVIRLSSNKRFQNLAEIVLFKQQTMVKPARIKFLVYIFWLSFPDFQKSHASMTMLK